MSAPRPNWDPHTPSPASECVPPEESRGGEAHSPAGERVGEGGPNPDDWRKSLALCLICAF